MSMFEDFTNRDKDDNVDDDNEEDEESALMSGS